MHGYPEVKNSLEAICLGQRSRAWIKHGLEAWTLGRGEMTSVADIAHIGQDEDVA